MVKGGKVANVQWSPPTLGNYNGFKLKVIYYFQNTIKLLFISQIINLIYQNMTNIKKKMY